jgi:mono/diheme cytochrome c family protein
VAGLAALATCVSLPPEDPQAALIRRGRELFFRETFAGNGRTCGTCHPAENNLTIDPAFINTLPHDDPLFVAEFVPELREHFEKPELMRKFGLILENLDGFDDLANKFVMRGVPHTLGLRHSVASNGGPRTGLSGDGAPGDGSLRSFATGAVIQHFTKSLNRVAGVDFRLPSEEELDAMEAFMLSAGRQQELVLPLPLRGEVPWRGQAIFMDGTLGKCNQCHGNAGANVSFGGGNLGNLNFDTGVEDLPDQPARLTAQQSPADDGFGAPGDRTFNTPSLVEAADSGPFFHNNAIETIEGAVAFYNGDAFNNSPAGRNLAQSDPNGIGIRLDATQVVAVAAFLRVINALDNVRESTVALEASLDARPRQRPGQLLRQAAAEIGDAISVLAGGGLHPRAVTMLRRARRLVETADCDRSAQTREALDELARARAELVDTP